MKSHLSRFYHFLCLFLANDFLHFWHVFSWWVTYDRDVHFNMYHHTFVFAQLVKPSSSIIFLTLILFSFQVIEEGSRRAAEKYRFSLTVSVPIRTSSYITKKKVVSGTQWNICAHNNEWFLLLEILQLDLHVLTCTTYPLTNLKFLGCFSLLTKIVPWRFFALLLAAKISSKLGN